MLAMSLMILAIALFTLVDGTQVKGATSAKAPNMQKNFTHEAAFVEYKATADYSTHIAGSSSKQNQVPEIKHTKKAGEGYMQGSPLFEKQQKRKSTEMLLPPPPEGRQQPSLAVILICLVLGVMVLTIAGCINREFLVRRYKREGDLGDLAVSPPPYKDNYPPPPGYIDRQMRTPARVEYGKAPVEYVDPTPKSTRLGPPGGLDNTLPPSQQPVPVSTMPSQHGLPLQNLGPPASLGPTGNSPPGSANFSALPPPNSTSPMHRNFTMPPAQPGPPGAVYGNMPPQGPGYLPPPRSQQYASMPPPGASS